MVLRWLLGGVNGGNHGVMYVSMHVKVAMLWWLWGLEEEMALYEC